jgi:hypothetical protein
MKPQQSMRLLRPAIILFPWVFVSIFIILLNHNDTFMFAWWMLSENKPIEILTFIIAFFSFILGVKKCRLTFDLNYPRYIIIFYALFSLVMLFIAMEEIAWGQQFFNFETPKIIKQYNSQDEFTLHNISIIQGNNEWLRLLFGISVGIGVYFNHYAYLKKISVPNLLTGWVMLIVIHALIDIYNDYVPIQQQFDLTIRFLTEVFEFLIAMLALIYIALKLWENKAEISTTENS